MSARRFYAQEDVYKRHLEGGTAHQVAINVSDLPDPHAGANALHVGAHHALVVEEEQRTHDHVVVELFHISRLNVGPVINFLHVLGDRRRWNGSDRFSGGVASGFAEHGRSWK